MWETAEKNNLKSTAPIPNPNKLYLQKKATLLLVEVMAKDIPKPVDHLVVVVVATIIMCVPPVKKIFYIQMD